MANLSNPATANQAAFGQLGSAFANTNAATIQPPSGKAIVAIQFLGDTKFDVLTAEDQSQCFGINDTTQGAGSGGLTVDSGDIFPKGLTIYGRWTNASLAADQLTDGIICYFG